MIFHTNIAFIWFVMILTPFYFRFGEGKSFIVSLAIRLFFQPSSSAQAGFDER